MKSKKTISILILISISFVLVSCKVVAYRDISIGKYETHQSYDAHEIKIDIETRKANYFYIKSLSASSYDIVGSDTIVKVEYDGEEGAKIAKCSWAEATVAEDMKSITLKFIKNESALSRELTLFLDNDKNKDKVFLNIYQEAYDHTK